MCVYCLSGKSTQFSSSGSDPQSLNTFTTTESTLKTFQLKHTYLDRQEDQIILFLVLNVLELFTFCGGDICVKNIE